MIFTFPRVNNLSFRRLFTLFLLFQGVAFGTDSYSAPSDAYSIVDTKTSYGTSYAVVVSRDTYALEDWRKVADSLLEKHSGATLIIYENDVANAQEKLAKHMPRYTSFVARPVECGRDYIAEVHRLTRKLDDDPWLDTLWGVITGKDATQALRVVRASEPLEIHSALATTGINEKLLDEYFLISDGRRGAWKWKKTDKSYLTGNFKDTKEDVAAWAKHFAMSPDLIVTSFHGYENGVEMPFSRGIIRVVRGALYPFSNVRQARPDENTKALPPSPNPKVYFPVGNCLVGHVNSPNCMVTAMMGENGVNQMAGYTVNTWFGRGGWDMLNLWQSHPGRNTFSESYFFNQQWILHDIVAIDPKGLDYKIHLGKGEVKIGRHIQDMLAFGLKFGPGNLRARSEENASDRQLIGLLWDKDTVAFYGDPTWRASFRRPQGTNSPFSTEIVSEKNHHRFRVAIHNVEEAAKNRTPIGIIFGTRLKNLKLRSGQEYEPILADNFILVLKPWPQKGESEINIEFEGDPI